MANIQFKTQEEIATEELTNWRSGAKVSKFQAKAALKQAGLLKDVKTLMNGLAEDDLTRLAWEDAQEFQRNSPTIKSLATQLNLTDKQLDDLFEQAKNIEA